jgi:hypothetical protein
MYLDTLKARQALEVIRGHHRQENVSTSRLLMLLYLSERESWRSRRKPLLASRIVASKEMGPIHSLAGSIVKEPVSVGGAPSELLAMEITILHWVTERHSHQSELELLAITTDLPDWGKLRSKDFGMEIPYKVILASLGIDPQESQDLLAAYPALVLEPD